MKKNVSIILSVYNGEKKLKSTVESVLQQTYQDFEFIIIDDSSTDNTRQIIEQYEQQDNRILPVMNSINSGLTKNLIKGVELAQGQYIARLDAGDSWESVKLEEQIAFLEGHPEYVICATQVNYVAQGVATGVSWFDVEDEKIRNRFISRAGIFEHSSIVFRRRINYRKQFSYAQDLDLYLRISFLGKMYCLPEVFTNCESGNEGITTNKKYLQRQYQHYAYQFHKERSVNGKDTIDQEPDLTLKIHDTRFDKVMSKVSSMFFKAYVMKRTQRKNVVVWGILLLLALVSYPYLILDYCRKLKGKIIILLCGTD